MSQKYDKTGALLSGKPADPKKLAALAAWRARVKKAKGRDAAEAEPEPEKSGRGKKA